MQKLDLKIFIYECEMEELNEADRHLIEQAQQACNNSYAPYSHFHVGAAALLENGTIILGNNQENAAYPSGLCAERTAVFAAGANFPKQTILSLAVAARAAKNTIFLPVSPCGACRQAILEYEIRQEKSIRLLMKGPNGKIYIAPSVSSLLPIQFSGKDLLF